MHDDVFPSPTMMNVLFVVSNCLIPYFFFSVARFWKISRLFVCYFSVLSFPFHFKCFETLQELFLAFRTPLNFLFDKIINQDCSYMKSITYALIAIKNNYFASYIRLHVFLHIMLNVFKFNFLCIP